MLLMMEYSQGENVTLPAQVEQDVPLERNINSDFTLAATTLEYLDRRGE